MSVEIYSSGALVSSGAIITDATIAYSANKSMYVSSGGTANNTLLNSGGRMYIFSGGTASNTVANSGGKMYISSGGTAWETKEDGGYVYVENDADVTFASNTINNFKLNYGSMTVHKNTIANSTTLDSASYIYIFSGGIVNNTTVYGKMDIYNGGLANSTTVKHGSIVISSGGVASCITAENYGCATICSGGIANDITIDYTGCMHIDGKANNANVNSGGSMCINSVGSANNTTVNGSMNIYGYANITTVNSNGFVHIFSGGTLHDTTVNCGGRIYISNGGIANSTTVSSGGRMYIASDGVITDLTLKTGAWLGCFVFNEDKHFSQISNASALISPNVVLAGNSNMYIYNGGSMNSASVNGGGSMHIFSGGVANDTIVKAGGSMYISSGGTATNIIWTPCIGYVKADAGAYVSFASSYSGVYIGKENKLISSAQQMDRQEVYGSMYVMNEGITNSSTVSYWGNMYISSGGTANSTTVNSGYIYVYNGGIINNTNVDYCGYMSIASGAVANSTTISKNGKVNILSGGVANDTIISRYCSMYVSCGGTANRNILNGSMHIYSDGAAINTTVSSGGSMYNCGTINNTTVDDTGRVYISSNGIANSTIIKSGGTMHISSGGTATDTMTFAGGIMYVLKSGTHCGKLHIEAGAVVSAYSGSKIDFTITNCTTVDNYLINDLSLISGNPIYTITVSAKQAVGEYKLAQGAENFTGTITIGDATTEYGVIAVNGDALLYNNRFYALKQDKGNLTLDISKIGPPENLRGTAEEIRWNSVFGANDYSVQYSFDNMATALNIQTLSEAVDTYNLPDDSNFWRVCASGGEWSETLYLKGSKPSEKASVVRSNKDGDTDLFFARANGIWDYGYAASHQGIKDGWSGTSDSVSIYSKNKLEDLFVGSTDANILVMTDDANGDALFVDDIYSAFPDEIEAQARIAEINEIRAGAGDDVIDLTSQRFKYIGDGVTVYGGLGNDVIWANSGDNHLFGDAGNDRIVGGSDNDVIVGGAGNDRMHGGGGSDTFCFGENWGRDSVEQLADGEVILWFETGSEDFWNAETMTYSDGTNRVKVTGVSTYAVTLKFGEIETAIAGAFESFASEKIFEDQEKALLA